MANQKSKQSDFTGVSKQKTADRPIGLLALVESFSFLNAADKMGFFKLIEDMPIQERAKIEQIALRRPNFLEEEIRNMVEIGFALDRGGFELAWRVALNRLLV